MFESIAKTNTTHTISCKIGDIAVFESIAKTNTTHTDNGSFYDDSGLRVLLKQIQHTRMM